MKNTKIISAFPACGKTYLFKKYENDPEIKILDSDSSEFHWIYDENDNKILNPDWPTNYIEHIKDNIGKVDLIFVSSHDEIRDLLFNNNITYTLIIPCNRRTCMYEWIGRMYCRHNTPQFIDNVIKNWKKWLTDISNKYNYDHIIYLGEDEYLEDVIWIRREDSDIMVDLIETLEMSEDE